MSSRFVAIALTLVVLLPAGFAVAQRGAGQREGVARQADRPDVQAISGALKEIRINPCEQTTGRSPLGAHLILESGDRELNVHLGPASEVGDVIGMLRLGDPVQATAFRTERLPEDQYVAVTVSHGDRQVTLRDATLRPRWAGGRGQGPAIGQPGRGGPRGAGRAVARGPRLANSRVLRQSSELGLSQEQADAIEAILADAEARIREVLTAQQIDALRGRPRGGRGGGRGPR